jgi:hypothetical protein
LIAGAAAGAGLLGFTGAGDRGGARVVAVFLGVVVGGDLVAMVVVVVGAGAGVTGALTVRTVAQGLPDAQVVPSGAAAVRRVAPFWAAAETVTRKEVVAGVLAVVDVEAVLGGVFEGTAQVKVLACGSSVSPLWASWAGVLATVASFRRPERSSITVAPVVSGC